MVEFVEEMSSDWLFDDTPLSVEDPFSNGLNSAVGL